jgi:hypothetical protein
MESREVQFPDGERVIFIRFSEEEWNLMAEDNCDTVRLLENDAACTLSPLDDGSISFDTVTPEDIIRDGVGNRDWSQRSQREKGVWHLHVSFSGLPGVVCAEVHGDTDDEAGCAAIDKALVHLEMEEIWSADEVADCQEILRDGYCLHDLGGYCLGGCPGVRVVRVEPSDP